VNVNRLTYPHESLNVPPLQHGVVVAGHEPVWQQKGHGNSEIVQRNNDARRSRPLVVGEPPRRKRWYDDQLKSPGDSDQNRSNMAQPNKSNAKTYRRATSAFEALDYGSDDSQIFVVAILVNISAVQFLIWVELKA
jgi:hypothetical protein